MSLKEKGELGDSGDGTSYQVLKEAEFSTRTGRKIGKIKTSYLSSIWKGRSRTSNDGSVTRREGRGRRMRRLLRDCLTNSSVKSNFRYISFKTDLDINVL